MTKGQTKGQQGEETRMYHRSLVDTDAVVGKEPVAFELGTYTEHYRDPCSLEAPYMLESAYLQKRAQEKVYIDCKPYFTEYGAPHYIGNAQAWYYTEDRVLVIWEFFIYRQYCEGEPQTDSGLLYLWRRFEDWLLQQFPQTRLVLTPAWEPLYSEGDWRLFLEKNGYTLQERVGAKEVKHYIYSTQENEVHDCLWKGA